MSTGISIKNKKAKFEYEFLETFTAGIQLTGTEIKSIRAGKASIVEGYCFMKNGELFIKNMYIAEYEQGTYNNHEPKRDRKLLLNRSELDKLEKKKKDVKKFYRRSSVYVTIKELKPVRSRIEKLGLVA